MTDNKQKKEIIWNLVNSGIAGLISFFSALVAVGHLTFEAVAVSLFTSIVVALVRFQKFWDGEKNEYLFRFA